MFFLDFEASSLLPGGYPIEVAWVGGDGQGEAYLISPHPEWVSPHTWSSESEVVHGISREALSEMGKPIPFVASRLLTVLSGREVFSDSPGFDGGWLDTLLDFADRKERIRLLPVEQAYGRACRSIVDRASGERERGLAAAVCHRIVATAENEEALRLRTKHRALEDALSMWRTWRLVSERAASFQGP